jgi:hypothetical protein
MMAHPPDDAHGASSATLDAAQRMTARGWVVFPCDAPAADPNKCTGASRACRRGTCKATPDPTARGKHPRVARWGQLDSPATDGQLAEWFGGRVPANVAVAAGPSHLLIVDEDEPGAFASYAAKVGAEIPETFTVTTGPRGDSRGRHFYFAAGDLVLGNVTGALPPGLDVRGGKGYGGYVIGPGSEHWSGVIYEADDWDMALAPVPEWLVEALTVATEGPAADGGGAGPRGKAGEPGTALPTSELARWTDAPRYGWPERFLDDFTGRCASLVGGGDAFRHGLFNAARDGWRCVALGLISERDMRAELDTAVWRVWHDDPKWCGGPNEEDEQHIDDAERAAPLAPWRLTPEAEAQRAAELAAAGVPVAAEPVGVFTTPARIARARGRALIEHDDGPIPDTDDEPVTSGDDTAEGAEPCTTAGNRPVDDLTESDDVDSPVSTDADMAERAARQTATADDQEYAKVLAYQRNLRRAREELDAEGRTAVTFPTLDEFLDGPDPDYLVPGMLYRGGLAVIFGAPGAAKSFLALDIVLSLCAGQEWHGHKLRGRNNGQGVAHYVMAEGEPVNRLRTKAWLHYHGFDRGAIRGRFHAIPGQEIRLTVAGIRDYLPRVIADQPDIIILDTKNRLFVGKESQGEDYAVMLYVLSILQRAAGGATIVLVDHSGLGDDSRARGSNAQQGGVDTEIKVIGTGGTRTAVVTRDKSAPLEAVEWHFRLEPVEIPRPPHVAAPAVCVPVDEADEAPISIEGKWWTDNTPLPPEVEALRGKGRRLAIAIYRVLRWVGGSRGLTRAELKRALKQGGQGMEGPRGKAGELDESGFQAACVSLAEARITGDAGKAGAYIVLTVPFGGGEPGLGAAVG